MIIGVGTDLVEIERVGKACERRGFLMHVYTEQERRQAKGSASKLAGSFAVKEAVAKALGTGFRGFLPADVEVLRNELGKPEVCLHRGALTRFAQLGGERLEVSISNTEQLAMAFAVAEGRGEYENPCDGNANEGNRPLHHGRGGDSLYGSDGESGLGGGLPGNEAGKEGLPGAGGLRNGK